MTTRKDVKCLLWLYEIKHQETMVLLKGIFLEDKTETVIEETVDFRVI